MITPTYPKIPRVKVLGGILVGLFYAFVFYAFMYLIREVFRVLSVTEAYDIWVLSDKEVNFYNLFFAFVAVIMAQSACFAYWFDRPRRFFERGHYRNTAVVNDQRALNWYFLSWFSKLAIFFGIIFGLAFYGGFYVFSFYPDYNFLFILIVIVLFLQSWSTLRLSFKRKSFKLMWVSIVVVSTVAFSLSRINLVDYKAINQIVLEKNIYHNYDLNTPEVLNYEMLHQHSLIENVYVVQAEKQDAVVPLLVVENTEIGLHQLKEKIKYWRSTRGEYERPHIIYLLHIDAAIKMKYVNRLKHELSKSGATRIAYAIVPENPKYDIGYYKNLAFRTKLPNWQNHKFDLQKVYDGLSAFPGIIEIRHQADGKCFVNNKPVKPEKIKGALKQVIVREPDCVIKYHVNDSIAFADYLRVLSIGREAINELRNAYADSVYSKQFDELNQQLASEVVHKFPLRIFELRSDLNRMINN